MNLFKKKKDKAPIEENFFSRLKSGLNKTRHRLTDGLNTALLGKKQIDDQLFLDIETLLLNADLGASVTQTLIDDLTKRLSRKHLQDGDEVIHALKEDMIHLLEPVSQPLNIDKNIKPYVILMVGVNGTGKTTTIGKLAKHFQDEGKTVLLAAGDTFRAAAIEQLQVWGERNHIPVIAQAHGSDSASVIYDAISSARAKKIDVVIADTAGRLHTQTHLMEELKKIVRVIKKQDEQAPHEIMLVLDASIGQNAINQARQFNDAIHLSGLTITKLDGTAKGGAIFAIAKELNLPIRFIGVGEQMDDLQTFCGEQFVHALFES